MAANPTAWFVVMEAQFHLAGITITSTRFYHALAALPPEVVSQLSSDTLTAQDYDCLKNKVVELHEASKPEILDRFLRDRPLTGKPSHYLAEMTQLAAKAGVSDEVPAGASFQRGTHHRQPEVFTAFGSRQVG